MKSSKSINSSAGAGVFAAIVASLCCITPVLAFTSGISGIASTFSWIEPFRPYLIGFTVLVLGFAWYQKLKPKTEKEIECACDDESKPSFWQSRRFLGIVTIFAGLMLAFPSYSHVFYPNIVNENPASTSNPFIKDDGFSTLEINVDGMTCTGCETHLAAELSSVDGVNSAEVSYKDGKAIITYDSARLSGRTINQVVENAGYKVKK